MTCYFSCQTPLCTASELNSTKHVSIDEANIVPETGVIYASALAGILPETGKRFVS